MKKLLTATLVIAFATTATTFAGDYGTKFFDDYDSFQRDRARREAEYRVEEIERRIQEIENARWHEKLERIRNGEE